ncbi:MAG: modification methylase, HemK family protein [Candidatus Saccharibacteria bacterium]|nr:modification methylase, HemK family protein [Candidatus Saccharibacteria bacterium]
MTLAVLLKEGEQTLSKSGIPSARLDTLILLEDLLARDRSWLLAHPEVEVSAVQATGFRRKIKKRTTHEPLSYIRGFSDFYGRTFKVNRRVLVPRPESEAMIELLKTLELPKNPTIADIGTGTGCLGITAALELHGAAVDLYDIDSSALAVARHNAHLHEVHVGIHKRDLLNRPARRYDALLANLPYVPDSWKLNEAAMHEPRLAQSGGKDGLDLYRRFFKQLETLGWDNLVVLTEALAPQHEELARLAKTCGFGQLRTQGLIQVFSN